MIKVGVMYPNTPGASFNHEYYRDKHMPMVKAKLGAALKCYTVDKGLAETPPAHPPPTWPVLPVLRFGGSFPGRLRPPR